MLPQQFPRLRVLHRLPFAGQAALIVVAVVDSDTVAFAQVADVCQPAVVIILPLLCRFAVHRAVSDTVRFIVVPEGDKPLIFTLREFSGQVIIITLRPPVKAALLYQPVQRIVAEVAVAAVLVSQTDDTSGSIVLHTARQPALRGADRLSPRIVLCLAPVAVRGDNGSQVACGVVLILRFTALCVFHRG
ncbi:Secreted protein [Escherichia coli]